MKVLPAVTPTDEQLKIISRMFLGEEVIRGSAGSGKTTTAILRLRGLLGYVAAQRTREASHEPVRALVLTFNRTLRGYIEELVNAQVRNREHEVEVQVSVDTFSRWAYSEIRPFQMLDDDRRETAVAQFGKHLPFDGAFMNAEIEYVLGRFLPEQLEDYITCERVGRGNSPRVDASTRVRILNEVLRPYSDWKRLEGLTDWTDLQVGMATREPNVLYDVIIADETQDFSANQIRAIENNRADRSSVTFILDTAQRIYARGFLWREVGLSITSANSHRLENNYRNTKQIAALALPLIKGISGDEVDATIPNLDGCRREGPLPLVLVGRYRGQVARAIEIVRNIPDGESIAFLHPAEWFSYLKGQLAISAIPYVSITRKSDWPTGSENVALSTIASAKGLEFDHVFLLGLSNKALSHGPEDDDSDFLRLRRLLAMGICRARMTVTMGTNPVEESDLFTFLDEGTFARKAV